MEQSRRPIPRIFQLPLTSCVMGSAQMAWKRLSGVETYSARPGIDLSKTPVGLWSFGELNPH
jgi:hypothetical protein